MTFPYVTAITAGLLMLLQMTLAFSVSAQRGKADTWVGDGGNGALLRSARRHGNLAENAGLFIAGFALLELSRASPRLLVALCASFVLVRLLHALGLSRLDTRNPLRLFGGIGTYLIGLALGSALIWAGLASTGGTPS